MLEFLEDLIVWFSLVFTFLISYFMHPINKEKYWLKLLVVLRGESSSFLLVFKRLSSLLSLHFVLFFLLLFQFFLPYNQHSPMAR